MTEKVATPRNRIVSKNSGKAGWFLEEMSGEITLRYRPEKNSFPWYVASVTASGQLNLPTGIARDVGLKVNRDGSIRTEHV